MTAKELRRLAVLEAKHGHSLGELGELVELQNKVLKEQVDSDTKTWGNWKYNSDSLAVQHQTCNYEIELSRIDTTAKLGEWLLHLCEKPRFTTEDLGYLVRALQDLEEIGYHAIEGRGEE